MISEKRYWSGHQLLYGLRLLLKRYRSSQELYNSIKEFKIRDQAFTVSYSQFTRYLRGESCISGEKADYILSYLLEKIDPVEDLIRPRIEVKLDTYPIQVDLVDLLNEPSISNFLSFFLCHQENLFNRFEAILTHPEAVPLAVSFSQILEIPWYSISFRRPSIKPQQIKRYSYLIDQEHVSTVYFNQKLPGISKKKVLIINDYIRRGGLLDILFKIVEENLGEVSYLFAIVGIGSHWKRFSTELGGRIKVPYLLSQ